MKRFLPLLVTAIFALWILGSLRVPADKPGARAVQAFGKLPVVAGGRFQPLDSFARNSLLQLRGKSTANLEPWSDHPKILSATEWLLETAMKPESADELPVFRVDHPELIGLLNLPAKDLAKKSDGKHYAWNQIAPKLAELRREAERANAVESSHRNPFDQAVVKLWNARRVYESVKNCFGPAASGNVGASLVAYQKQVDAGRAAYAAMRDGKPYDADALEWFSGQFESPVILPGAHTDDWKRVAEYLVGADTSPGADAALASYAKLAAAYRANDANAFNQAVADYRSSLAGNFSTQLTKARREFFYNAFQPFYKAMIIYIVTFLLACASWFNLSDWLRRSAAMLIPLAFVVHTGGLIFRMWLEGRPPVTNLYSSAIFIGWGAVILGMILEKFYKDGIGAVVAAAMGFITLVIAHNLSLGGDTMEMMRAVLDTNFWLATHVVVVTLGYASTFVAGFLAMVYIIMGAFTKNLTTPMSSGSARAIGFGAAMLVKTDGSGQKTLETVSAAAQRGELGKSLTRMVYGIVCFATLFSFVGTVLGGIWADQSWGRFWGWDVKENGALIIVLWNALILHARWGGLVRERGLMCMAIFGNVVTAWSWFGVNMLGIGLHSYGFTDAAFRWLLIFVASQATLIVLGLLPLKAWKSLQPSAGK